MTSKVSMYFKKFSKGIFPRVLISLALSVIAVVYIIFDFQQYFSLKFLQESISILQEYYIKYPLMMMGSFFLIYVVSTSLCIPSATVLSLAGGAIFGLSAGTLLVSFASSIGATLAMLLARFLLKNWVQRRFKSQLKNINIGIKKEGGFYLFTLRLVPLIPFFVINLGMGLPPMRVGTFYWISQFGMFTGTLVYVNAGSELGKIESMDDILSPLLIVSFILVGVFPLIIKKLLAVLKAKRTKFKI